MKYKLNPKLDLSKVPGELLNRGIHLVWGLLVRGETVELNKEDGADAVKKKLVVVKGKEIENGD